MNLPISLNVRERIAPHGSNLFGENEFGTSLVYLPFSNRLGNVIPVDNIFCPVENLKHSKTLWSNRAFGFIQDPGEHDVLFGRGRCFLSHPGNKRLQMIIDLYRDEYLGSNRDQKFAMTQRIVQLVKFSGNEQNQFLKFNKKLEKWIEVNDKMAREKVSHALRDRKERKSLSTRDRTIPEELQTSAVAPLSTQWSEELPLVQSFSDEEVDLLLDLFLED